MGMTPGPWDWMAVSARASGGFHLYLIDSTGRKIAALWGGKDEKAANARAIAKVPEMVADWEAIATENPPQGMTFKQWVRGMANKYRDLAAIEGEQGK